MPEARLAAERIRGAAPYADGLELVLELLGVLDARLTAAVEHMRRAAEPGEDLELRGVVVTDAEAVRLLGIAPGLTRAPGAAVGGASLWSGAEERIAASRALGIALPLDAVRDRFGLTAFETDCLLTCLAPEVDAKYERLFGYLNDDLTRRHPTVSLLLRLLCPPGDPPIRYRRYLLDDAPLLCEGLLSRVDDGGAADAGSHLTRRLRVEPGLARFLLGEPGPAADLAGVRYVPSLAAPTAVEDAPAAPRQTLEAHLDRFFGPAWPRDERLVCLLVGRPGSGRFDAARAACAARGLGLLPLDGRRLLVQGGLDSLLTHAFRDSLLHASPLLVAEADVAARDRDRGGELRFLLERHLDEQGWLLFLTVSDAAAVRDWFPRQRCIEIEFPEPAIGERAELWRRLLRELEPPPPAAATDELADALAAKFRLTPGQVGQAIHRATSLRPGTPGGPTWAKALHGCAQQLVSPRLGELARRITPLYGWDDLVLPPEKLDLLRDVVRHLRYRRTVMGEWGFDRAMSRGKGVAALFAGPSGTGKTMAAEVIARELAMDLFRIDLAAVVSKYIGETEKNLARVFEEAEHADAILFFDEADALFGKRSEVRDAHDRYANIEIGYLLQRIESYEGLAILATNLRQNLDDAFVRRLHVVVEFPLPAVEDRLLIWEKSLPADAPRADDIDLRPLARGFDLAGGHIRNIALAAAFLAAEEGGAIGMAHLVRATARELEKMGKRTVKEQFGEYVHLLAPAFARAAAGAAGP